jgi:hypothetical protein
MRALEPHLEPDFDRIPGAFVVPEVLGVYRPNSPRVLVFTVDARVLGDERETFMSISKSPEAVRAMGCVQDPTAVVTLLMLLMHIISKPSLGRSFDVEAEIHDAKKFISRGGEYVPRTDIYLEVLKTNPDLNPILNPEAVVGFRFWLGLLDMHFDPNYGIMNQIKANAKMKHREPLPTDPPKHPAQVLIHAIKDETTYIDSVVSCAMPWINPDIYTYAAPLEAGASDANLYNVLSMDNAIPRQMVRVATGREQRKTIDGQPEVDEDGRPVLFDVGEQILYPTPGANEDEVIMVPEMVPLISGTIQGLHPEYMNMNNYRVEVDTPQGQHVTYRFPFGATRLHPNMHEPNVIYSMRLFESAISNEWKIDLSPEQQRRVVMDEINRARVNVLVLESSSETIEDDLDKVRRINEAALLNKSPTERRELRESRTFLSRFMSLTSPTADIPPALQAVFKFYEDMCHRARTNNTHFSVIDQRAQFSDPKLSPFGNAQVNFMLECEFLKGISTVHQEVLMMHKIAMAVLEVKRHLKPHMILAGSPGCGKSHVLDLLMKMMIPGTWVTTSKGTKCAMTAKVNYDEMAVFHDEVPEHFLTPDGDSELKEVISTGSLTTRMTQIIDNERREIVTLSRHSNAFLMATNVADMSKPMRDRIPIHAVSDFNPRENRSAANSILSQYTRSSNQQIANDTARFQESLQIQQMLVSFVYMFISCGLLQSPDLSVAIIYIMRFSSKLRASGIVFPVRELERHLCIVLELTIENAVHIMCHTKTIWAEPKPFEFSDLFALQEYLFATEEIALFTLSLLSSVFFHPQEHAVMETLARKILLYDGEGANLRSGCNIARNPPSEDNMEGDPDYNYIELTGLYSGYRTPIQQAAARIAARMHNTNIRVSENIITDILLRCEENSLMCMPYVGTVARGQRTEDLPLIISKSHNLWVLRAYLDNVLKATPGEDFFERAIREMRHKHTPTQTLVLGHALRVDPKNFYPYLLRTVHTGPKPSEVIDTIDFSKLDAGYIRMRDLNIQPGSLKVRVTNDMEMMKWLEYMKTLGRTQAEVLASRAEPSRMRHSPMKGWTCPFRMEPTPVLVPTDEVDEDGAQIVQTLMDDDGRPVMETRVCGAGPGECGHDVCDYPQCFIECEARQASAPAEPMEMVYEMTREDTPKIKRRRLDKPVVEMVKPPLVVVTTTTTSCV